MHNFISCLEDTESLFLIKRKLKLLFLRCIVFSSFKLKKEMFYNLKVSEALRKP